MYYKCNFIQNAATYLWNMYVEIIQISYYSDCFILSYKESVWFTGTTLVFPFIHVICIAHNACTKLLILLSTGCDVNTLNAKRHSPLYVACEKNDDAVALKILGHKKFMRKLFLIPSIPQPLYAAVGNNHVHLVDLLIKAGCNINMVSA